MVKLVMLAAAAVIFMFIVGTLILFPLMQMLGVRIFRRQE